MVLAPPLAYLVDNLLTISFLKMYEFATGHCLFKPEAKDDISRDVVHLAQMTQRTGQVHSDAVLKQYEIQQNQNDLKGKEMDPKISNFIHPHPELLRRATAEGAMLAPIESEMNKSATHSNGAEEVATFTRVMLSFLAFDPTQRPHAAEALLDTAFDHV